MKRQAKPNRRKRLFRLALVLVLAALAAALGWARWVYWRIDYYANHDQAALADAIAVFGAAEYNGKPSPVYRARLNHALTLYRRGLAPLIITLGGDGGDNYSEGGVGRDYLVAMGVPEQKIIAETVSRNSVESTERIAVIAHTNEIRRIVVVSDGAHLFRIHEICRAQGLDVLTSPRPRVPVEGGAIEGERIRHEILSYTLWRLRAL